MGIIDRASSLKGWFSQAKESESNPFSDAQSYDYGVMKSHQQNGKQNIHTADDFVACDLENVI